MKRKDLSKAHLFVSLFVVLTLALNQLVVLAAPLDAVEPVKPERGGHLASPLITNPEEQALFRTRVTLRQPRDRQRLEDMGVVFLEEEEGTALLLVTSEQLETLARLRFKPVGSDEVGALGNAYAETHPWLAASLQPVLRQAQRAQLARTLTADSTGHQVATKDLQAALSAISTEQQAALATFTSLDDDADGLTNTEESWWCTDPLNPNSDGDAQGYKDGQEVAALLDVTIPRAVRWGYGAPFGPPNAWPNFNNQGGNGVSVCNDGDFDTIPDYAEAYMVGSRVPYESTDNDKFDDGQELFGITYCPGAPTNCGYGSYPAIEYWNFIKATMPNWVLPPGDNLFVAAVPVPEVHVQPGSWTVERVATITTSEGEIARRAKSYETSVTRGESSTVSDTINWNEWEEVSQAIELPVDVALYQPMKVNVVDPVSIAIGAAGLIVAGGSLAVAGLGLVPSAISAYTDWEMLQLAKDEAAEKDEAVAATMALVDTTRATNAELAAINSTLGYGLQTIGTSLDGIHQAIDRQGMLMARGLHDISYQISRPRYTETRTSGSSSGGAQSTSHEVFEEHSIAEGEAFTSGQSWETAWAEDSSHVANLTFSYTVKNSGTEYARELRGLVFNIYLGDDNNPVISFPAWEQFPDGKLENLFPTGPSTPPGELSETTFATDPIALSLEQMKRIDLGEPITIKVADYSFGADELFYADAVNGGVSFYIEDGVADGDEAVDTYIIPTWGTESVLDALSRYFPYDLDSDGEINALWTPEFDGIDPPVWNEYYLSNIAWWHIFLTQDDFNGSPLHLTEARAGTSVIFRFGRDSDGDGYNDRAEFRYYCALPVDDSDWPFCADGYLRANVHPQPDILAGYVTARVGNTVTATLALENTGSFDAFGVDALMISPDDTTTVGNNLVGGNGRVRAGQHVAVGSMILNPDLTSWGNSTAEPYAAGNYLGSSNRTFTFSTATDGVVGQAGTTMDWSDGEGRAGILDLGASYHSPLPLEVADGFFISFKTGTIASGASFSVDALTPRDTFTYTINSEPYTSPIVIVSSSDPTGSKRFVTPVELTDLGESLVPFHSDMLGEMKLSIVATAPYEETGNNSTGLVLTNPHPSVIEQGHLYLTFVSDGTMILEEIITADFPTGPTVLSEEWNSGEFAPEYNPDGDNLLVGVWTDSEDNIIDTAARPFSTFQEDPQAKTKLSDQTIDFGTVVQGEVLHRRVAVGNTGAYLATVYTSVNGTGLELADPGLTYIKPHTSFSTEVTLNTYGLPTGAYAGQISVRTENTDNPIQTVTVTAEIVAPSSAIVAYAVDEYKPLEEILGAFGPLEQDDILSYVPTTGPGTGVEPLFVTRTSDGGPVGYGRDALATIGSGASMVTESTISQIRDAKLMGIEVPDLRQIVTDEIAKGAVELTELRTADARVYQRPDGTAFGFVFLGDERVGPSDNAEAHTTSTSIDAYVQSGYPTTPVGNTQNHYLGWDTWYGKGYTRIYATYNLPSLPSGSTITNARAYFYQYAVQATSTYATYACRTYSGWGEHTVTWNNEPGAGYCQGVTNVSASVGWKYWTITSYLQDWITGTPNYGMRLHAANEGAPGGVFRSRECSPTQCPGQEHPYLWFEYNPPAPAAPTIASISNSDGDGSYSVDWSEPTYSTGYTLQRRLNGGSWSTIYTGSSSIYGETGRAAGEWCYQVRASGAGGTSAWSGAKCTTVVPPAPSAPAISSISNSDGDGSFDVDWSEPANATSYTLQRKHDGGSWSSIYTGSSSIISESGRTSGEWCYQVRASGAGGTSAWSTSKCTIVNTAPNPPTNLVPSDGSGVLGHVVDLSLTDAGDPDNAPSANREFRFKVDSATTTWNQTTSRDQSTTGQVTVPLDGVYTVQAEAYDGLETSGWTSPNTFDVYSIEKIASDQVSLALPEAITDSATYRVQYGLVAEITAANGEQVSTITIPKRQYEDFDLDLILTEAVAGPVQFAVDVGNNGSKLWSGSLTWAGNVLTAAGDQVLVEALNEFLASQPGSNGEPIQVPVSVSLSVPGKALLTNALLVPITSVDPQVAAADITFSNVSPVEQDVVGVSAAVQNAGPDEVQNVIVSFIANSPDFGDWLIASDFIAEIAPGAHSTAAVTWDTAGFTGDVSVRVVADPADQIVEQSEANNEAVKNITVLTRPDLALNQWSFSDAEPIVGESINVTTTVGNNGLAAAGAATYSLYEGNPDNGGTLVDSVVASSIGGQGEEDLTFDWTPATLGEHQLFLAIDAAEDVSESNEGNNRPWKVVYAGLPSPVILDSGDSASDPLFSEAAGFGAIDDALSPDVLAVCSEGAGAAKTFRLDPGGAVVYRFEHLQPGHFYHLDVTLYECDGVGRQESIYIDAIDVATNAAPVAGPYYLGDGEVRRISLLVDPAFYADHEIEVTIHAPGIDGAVVSEVNLYDIDYWYADAGGGNDPQYTAETTYGWQDGVASTTWGTLPYQSARVDQSDNELRYQFDGLLPQKQYNLNFTFWQPEGNGRVQNVIIDGVTTDLSVNTGDYQLHRESVTVPAGTYDDGSITARIVRSNAATGAMVNEVSLEELTLLSLPMIQDVTVSNVNDGAATISWVTDVAATGSVSFGTSPALGQVAQDNRGGQANFQIHYVTLTGLTPNTTYYFAVNSDNAVDDNAGGHYSFTTGPTISLPSSDSIFGQLFAPNGSDPAENALVTITLSDANGQGSTGSAALLTALVDSAGYWNTNLGTARTIDLQAQFIYSAGGDEVEIHAENGAGCSATQIVDTAADTPAPSMTLNCDEVVQYNISNGWNLLSSNVTTDPNTTAAIALEEVDSQGGDATEIDRWQNGTWQGHTQGYPFNNFDLELGRGYFVKALQNSVWERHGLRPETPQPLSFVPGWNLVGLAKLPGPRTAEQLLSEIQAQGGNCSEIDRFDFGSWQGHILGLPFNNFAVNETEGYFIKCTSSSSYTPGAATLITEQPWNFQEVRQQEAHKDAQIGSVQVTNRRDVAVTITWETDLPSDGWVMFGPEGQARNQKAVDERGEDTVARQHQVTLKGLSPETTYEIEVNSGSAVVGPTAVTTNPSALPLAPFTFYGQIEGANGRTAVGALVLATLVDREGKETEALSALVDGYGYWVLSLPIDDCSEYQLQLTIRGEDGSLTERSRGTCDLKPGNETVPTEQKEWQLVIPSTD